MTYKRTPTDDEIEALANRFRPLWRTGEAVRPWLRKHALMLIDLVHDDWSWAGVATALDRAGIAYRTGNPWQAEQLRAKIAAARRPLKYTTIALAKNAERQPEGNPAYCGIDGATPPATSLDSHTSVPTPGRDLNHQPDAGAQISPSIVAAEPRFKPAIPKPYAPPIELTAGEKSEIDENRKRILGY